MQNPFKEMLASKNLPGPYPVGTWAMSSSPLVAEALGCAGFDWAVVDMEHSPLDLQDLVHMLQAIAGTGMLPITRVPWNDAVMVKRVLDAGAQSLMFPFVQNADEAKRAVAVAAYSHLWIAALTLLSRDQTNHPAAAPQMARPQSVPVPKPAQHRRPAAPPAQRILGGRPASRQLLPLRDRHTP